MTVKTDQNIQHRVTFLNNLSGSTTNECAVTFDENGCPTDILGHRHHFHDTPRSRKADTSLCPMDLMIEQVKRLNLRRPTARSRE